MYDYLSTISADYNYTLSIAPHRQLVEQGEKNIKIKEYDDDSETRIIRSTQTVFFVTLEWDYLSESNAGIIFGLYHDSAKACGTAKTFKWLNYAEPSARRHTYVVRFAVPLSRSIIPAQLYGYASIQLKVLGRIADA
jgi:hypothetical protein